MTVDAARRASEYKRRRAQRNIASGRHPREVLVKVPNEPLRIRYLALTEEGVMTASEVARAQLHDSEAEFTREAPDA